MKTKSLFGLGTVLCANLFLLAACGSDETNDALSTQAAYAELKKAVASCADEQATCVAEAAGDTTAVASRDAAFEACSASKGKQAEEKLAAAASQCAEAARSCREQGTDKQSCKEQLKS